jgi:hypothetical protein
MPPKLPQTFLWQLRSKRSSSACKTCRYAYYMSVYTSIHTDISFFFIYIRSKRSSNACKTCRYAYYMSVHTHRYLVFLL